MADVGIGRDEFAEFSAQLLGSGHHVRFRAQGQSMVPAVRDGDVLTVAPARLADLRVGEIALLRVGDRQVVAHRVLGRRTEDGQPVLMTRGDAVGMPPDAVREGDVLGRVIERERNGRAVRLDRGPRRLLGRLLVVWLPVRARLARLARAAAESCRAPS